jgi:hypothetical protein
MDAFTMFMVFCLSSAGVSWPLCHIPDAQRFEKEEAAHGNPGDLTDYQQHGKQQRRPDQETIG